MQVKSIFNARSVAISALAAVVCLYSGAARPAQATPPAGYTLVWSDEFNEAVGSAPNPANWGYDIGAGGWGNNELETYTSSTANSSIQTDASAPNGTALVITATNTGGDYDSA